VTDPDATLPPDAPPTIPAPPPACVTRLTDLYHSPNAGDPLETDDFAFALDADDLEEE